ncbi:BTAD domain-containing putative transcriptional regulator [Micromonospora sp. FIMYZ51]|uniref:AfsR/SARP family transcriptional regulator n=1 Tax=Micromonospora sp. FIMYZ51 TaxID=3051832 RepID=UPI00311F917D
MELRLLGPVEIGHGDTSIVPGRRMHRLLLGLLALQPNAVLPSDDLVEALWQGRAPRTARSMIHSRISELRAALADAGLGADRIAILTAGDGYRLVLDPEAVDAHRFRRLLARARAEPAGLTWPQRRDLLREAVGLWRGPAFGGWLPHRPAPPEVQALEEARLTALEQCYEAELNAGTDGSSVVDAVAPLAAQHPSRERFTALLMRAYAAAGRAGEALRAYERHRRWLAAELGSDPDPELRRLHLELLRSLPPAAGTATAPPGPAQLPAVPSGFVGRRRELDQLDEWVERGTRTVALVGPPGVGKTALALRWAHAHSRRPEVTGALYADLRGNDDAPPLPPEAVLERFLRALGVPGEAVPADPEERAARYRTELAHRAGMVVLLDNAASSAQVRPLLPGSGEHLLLVTSRYRLDGLVASHGIGRLSVPPMTEQEAAELLVRSAGPAQSDPLRRVAALCDRLPLALRIAAARLDEGGAAALADRLAGEGSRLGLLTTEDVSVRAALGVSARALPAPARAMFQHLGVHPGPRPSTRAAAALAGVPVEGARTLLDQLTAAHLVQPVAEERHQLHDLVRLFAAEQAATRPEEADAALLRALGWYRDAANEADRTLRPAERPNFDSSDPGLALTTAAAALAWLDAEADNLVAAVESAAARHPRLAWQIAAAMYGWLFRRQHRDRWVQLYTLAAEAARRAGDIDGEAMIAGRLAIPLSLLNRHDEAARSTGRAYQLRQASGDRLGAATALLNLAAIENNAGRPEAAIRRLTEAERQSRTLTEATHLRALVRSNLGEAHLLTGRYAQAVEHYTAALELAEAGCGARDVAEILVGLARTHREAGTPRAALSYAERAVTQAQTAGDLLIEAEAREQSGRARIDLGDLPTGLGELRDALRTYRSKGHRATDALARYVAGLAGDGDC